MEMAPTQQGPPFRHIWRPIPWAAAREIPAPFAMSKRRIVRPAKGPARYGEPHGSFSFRGMDGGELPTTAIRVRLVDLHNPTPPPSGGPSPLFSQFEGQIRYVNTLKDGNNNPVFHCADSQGFDTYFACARLGCEPEYRDWPFDFGGQVLWVYGDTIIPDSDYAVALLDSSCEGNEDDCLAASPDLPVSTAHWGDINGDGRTTSLDMGGSVNKVKDVLGAAIEPRAKLYPSIPDPRAFPVTALDLAQVVDSAKGNPYPFHLNCPTSDIGGEGQPP